MLFIFWYHYIFFFNNSKTRLYLFLTTNRCKEYGFMVVFLLPALSASSIPSDGFWDRILTSVVLSLEISLESVLRYWLGFFQRLLASRLWPICSSLQTLQAFPYHFFYWPEWKTRVQTAHHLYHLPVLTSYIIANFFISLILPFDQQLLIAALSSCARLRIPTLALPV